MAEDNGSGTVTRREFTVLAGTTLTMIGILALTLASKAEGFSYPIVLWIIAIGCLIPGAMYNFASLRLGRAPSSHTEPVAASDKPGP